MESRNVDYRIRVGFPVWPRAQTGIRSRYAAVDRNHRQRNGWRRFCLVPRVTSTTDNFSTDNSRAGSARPGGARAFSLDIPSKIAGAIGFSGCDIDECAAKQYRTGLVAPSYTLDAFAAILKFISWAGGPSNSGAGACYDLASHGSLVVGTRSPTNRGSI